MRKQEKEQKPARERNQTVAEQVKRKKPKGQLLL